MSVKYIKRVDKEGNINVINTPSMPVKASMLANGSMNIFTTSRRVKHAKRAKEDSSMQVDSVDNANVPTSKEVQQASVPSVSDVLKRVNSTQREDIKEHVRMLLIKRGLTLEKNIDRLASMLEESHEQLKAKDKIYLMEYLNVLHGVRARVNDAPEQGQVQNNLVLVQNMETSQVIGLLQDMNEKTQAYLSKLKERSIDYNQDSE